MGKKRREKERTIHTHCDTQTKFPFLNKIDVTCLLNLCTMHNPYGKAMLLFDLAQKHTDTHTRSHMPKHTNGISRKTEISHFGWFQWFSMNIKIRLESENERENDRDSNSAKCEIESFLALVRICSGGYFVVFD